MTTTAPTLTDRYVYAASRRLPEDQREDVARELRASIEDQTEAARLRDPALSPAEAEEQALIALGDPDALGDNYRGAPRSLIGPALFPGYVKVLRTLLTLVVPIVAVVIAMVDAFAGAPLTHLVTTLVATALSVAAQVCIWTTLGFAIAERVGAGGGVRDSVTSWSIDSLPDLPQAGRPSLGETVMGIVGLTALGGLIVWQHVQPPLDDDSGNPIPILDPDLWSFWLPVVLALLAVEALFEVFKYQMRAPWTRGFAVANAVVLLALSAPLLMLAAQERLLNPALVAHVQDHWTGFDPSVAHSVLFLSVLAVWVFDAIEGWRRAVPA